MYSLIDAILFRIFGIGKITVMNRIGRENYAPVRERLVDDPILCGVNYATI
jgi:hypothetical protein